MGQYHLQYFIIMWYGLCQRLSTTGNTLSLCDAVYVIVRDLAPPAILYHYVMRSMSLVRDLAPPAILYHYLIMWRSLCWRLSTTCNTLSLCDLCQRLPLHTWLSIRVLFQIPPKDLAPSCSSQGCFELCNWSYWGTAAVNKITKPKLASKIIYIQTHKSQKVKKQTHLFQM